MVSNNSVREILLSFFNSNPGIFTKEEERYILSYHDLVFDNEYCPELVREVFDELGLIPSKINIYDGFFKLVDDTFSVKDKNIIEIGGGVLPSLGKRIVTKIGNGKLTIYDPRLSKYLKDTEKMVLKREMFTEYLDVSNSDLLVALMPCKGAEDVIASALKNRKDFMIGLCEGGEHGDYFDYFEDEEEWRTALICNTSQLIRYKDMGKLKIKYLKEYGDPYPIIYNER